MFALFASSGLDARTRINGKKKRVDRKGRHAEPLSFYFRKAKMGRSFKTLAKLACD